MLSKHTAAPCIRRMPHHHPHTASPSASAYLPHARGKQPEPGAGDAVGPPLGRPPSAPREGPTGLLPRATPCPSVPVGASGPHALRGSPCACSCQAALQTCCVCKHAVCAVGMHLLPPLAHILRTGDASKHYVLKGRLARGKKTRQCTRVRTGCGSL